MVFGVLAVVPGLLLRQLAAQPQEERRYDYMADMDIDAIDSRQPPTLLAERTTVTVTELLYENGATQMLERIERRGQS